jgi:HlyD family secretion protein
MITELPAPIPVPFRRRLHDARRSLVPPLVLLVAVAAVAALWRDHVAAPTLTGQAEPVLANISSQKPGILAQLDVRRFQQVKAGDLIAQVVIAEPRVLESSLSVLRAEIEVLRVDMRPLALQQRTAMDYSQLQLDWMKERATLASARVNLQLAEVEQRRTQELFREHIASQQQLDEANATVGSLTCQVEELSHLVSELNTNFSALQLTNAPGITMVSDKPLDAAIAVQEAKLRLVEAELSPLTLRSPIDGVVSTIFHRAGETVIAGQPIVAIATANSVRIVGYLRTPVGKEPTAGAKVTIRARGGRRETGLAQVNAIGAQFEVIPDQFLGPLRLGTIEMGIPLDISVPPNLPLRPGELVDVMLLSVPD